MPRNSVAYDRDFYAWSREQARLLRSGEFSQVDIENVAEELEGMARSDRRALESRLEVLLLHLLKWRVQVLHRFPGWSGTVREQRRRIDKLLTESASLRPAINGLIAECYEAAREQAAEETGLPQTAFPENCPFSVDQVLAREFLPE